METLTPKSHHKDTSKHDLPQPVRGYQIIRNIYNIIKMPVLWIENNLKFKFTNGNILKWNQNKVTNQCAKEDAVCVKRLGNTCVCSVAATVGTITLFTSENKFLSTHHNSPIANQ